MSTQLCSSKCHFIANTIKTNVFEMINNNKTMDTEKTTLKRKKPALSLREMAYCM